MTERPPEFAGVIRIEWRASDVAAGQVMPGWMFSVRGEDGKPIFTVTGLTIHARADGGVWAECEMFAGPDGKPVYGGAHSTEIHLDAEKNILTGVFPFQVASMSVADD